MGVVIPLNEAQIGLEFACSGIVRPMVITFGVRPDTPGTPATTIATAIRDLYIGSTLGTAAAFSSAYTWRGVRVQKQTTAGIESAFLATNVVGSVLPNVMPPNVAVLISKNSGLGGRDNRGRMYWPPMAFNETVISNAGVISTAELNAEQTKWTNLFTAMLAGDYPMVIFHSDGSPSTLVSGVVLSNIVATQRRRLR